MSRILFKFIIYPFCDRALKNGRVKPKIVRKSSFGDMIFLTSHDYIWLHFICFLYCAKESVVIEISKVSQPLDKWLPLCKGGRKCKNNFFNQSLLHLLFSSKENFKFFEVALSAVFCNGAVGCIMSVWGYQHWNTANTTLDINLLFENLHKSHQTRCKICSNLTKCTTAIDFRLTNVFLLTLNTFHTLF